MKFNELNILFLNDDPLLHSYDLKDLCKDFTTKYKEFDKIKILSSNYGGLIFEDFIEGSNQLEKELKNYGWHGGIYGLVGDRFYNSNNEEFEMFILDGSEYGLSELNNKQLQKLETYCKKHNIIIDYESE